MIDLKAMRARAEAATQGEWEQLESDLSTVVLHTLDKEPGRESFAVEVYADRARDAAHIAGVDPQTVLALINELEDLRFRMAGLQK